MPIYDMYPYTNLHELNLDWIVKICKENTSIVQQLESDMSNLSDLADCLHARPDLSPPRLVCDYDLYVSGNIEAPSRNLHCSGISCTLINASADIYANEFHGSLSGNASTASYASQAANLGNLSIGSTNVPIYFSGGVPMNCGSTLSASITGNAATATTAAKAEKLDSVRLFTLTGAVSGSVFSDLASNLSITTTQNVIKQISASVATAAEIGVSGQTGVKAVGINGTDLDWDDPTFDPDTVTLLACEMALNGSIVGVSHNWLSPHGLTMTVIGDQGFDLDDFTDAEIYLYYIDPIS